MQITVAKQITELKNIEIEGITLLSEEEFRAYNDFIPNISRKWWLRTLNYEDPVRAKVVDEKSVVSYPTCISVFIRVRPALIIDFNPDDFKPGNVFEFRDKTWTIISCYLAICNDDIGDYCFNDASRETNEYETSDIKKHIEQWFTSKTTNKYDVTIEEYISETFAVEAESEEEAMEIAKEKYKNGEFILEPGNVTQRQIAVYDPQTETTTDWTEF